MNTEEKVAKRKAVQRANYLKKQEERKAKAKQQYDENRTEILEKKKAKRKAKKEEVVTVVDEEPENVVEDEADEEEALDSAYINEAEFLSKQRKARENYSYSSEVVEEPAISVREPITSIVVTPIEERISRSWFDFANTTLEPAFADHRLQPLFEDHRFEPAKVEIPIPDKEDIKKLGDIGKRVRIDAGKVGVVAKLGGQDEIAILAGGLALAGGAVEIGANAVGYFF